VREFHVIQIAGNPPTPLELIFSGEARARERCAFLNERAAALREQNPDPKARPIRFSVVSDGGSAKRLAGIIGCGNG
jgi:hypothetical protein